MRARRAAAGIVVVVAIFLTASASVEAVPIAAGAITDPLGDQTISDKDIVSALITIDSSGTALFSVTFAPGVSLGDADVAFELDTDQNPATGFAGVDSLHNDSSLMGLDFVVAIYGASFQGYAEVFQYVGSSWTSGGTFAASYSGTTMETTVPLSALGGDDGFMNFKVLSDKQLTMGSSTGVNDYAPDLGLAPGSTVPVVPEPATLSLFGLGLLAAARRRRRS